MENDSNADAYCRIGPSPAWRIACFYCGGGVPWFQCHCFRAAEARDGKRPRPVAIPPEQSPNGRPIIILDEEALANGWLRLPRYVVTERDKSVTASVTKIGIVTASVTDLPGSVTEVAVRLPALTAAERARRYRDRHREERRGG